MINKVDTDNSMEREILANGLELYLIDASRKLIGDRWMVRFMARVQVPVSSKFLPEDLLPESVDDLRATLGDSVTYEYVSERNFIDVDEKDKVFTQEKTSFMENTYQYLNRSEFPVRFVISQYRKKTEKRARDLIH